MSQLDLTILDEIYLRGPNRWSYRPALEVLVDIGSLEQLPSNRLPGLTARLLQLLPGLAEHGCSYGEPGGFVRRLEEGTWAAHILEHVTLELQTLAGAPSGFGRARGAGRPGTYYVVVSGTDEQLVRACLRAGRELLVRAIRGEEVELASVMTSLRAIGTRFRLHSDLCEIALAAHAARIPVLRMSSDELMFLGHGVKQRRVWLTETDRTSAIAAGIGDDVELSKHLLSIAGIPVAPSVVVRRVEDAWRAAEALGLPVVVKPTEGRFAFAVRLDLHSRQDVEAAFLVAQRHSPAVVIERQLAGTAHRLVVVGGELVGATSAFPVVLVGDGHASIGELVLAQEPGRGGDCAVLAAHLLADPRAREELSARRVLPETVLEKGDVLRLTCPASLGIDVRARLHPDLVWQAQLAVRVVGLDIASVDLIASDPGLPLAQQAGGVVGVRARPSLLSRAVGASLEPALGERIVRHLFPLGESGRIPLVGVGGSGDTTTVARLLGWLLHLHGVAAGVACRTGLYLDGRRAARLDSANWAGGRRLLVNRTLEAAVIESPSESLLREGLPYDRALIAIVTAVHAEPALLRHGLSEEKQFTHLIRTHVDVVLKEGAAILNADDPLALGLAEYSDGEVVLFAQTRSAEMAAHFARGGRGVHQDGQELVLTAADRVVRLRLAQFPGSSAALPAAAAAWVLGVAPELIASGVQGYTAAVRHADQSEPVAGRGSRPNL